MALTMPARAQEECPVAISFLQLLLSLSSRPIKADVDATDFQPLATG